MDVDQTLLHRMRRIACQRLESLQRAGVTGLKRSTWTAPPSVETTEANALAQPSQTPMVEKPVLRREEVSAALEPPPIARAAAERTVFPLESPPRAAPQVAEACADGGASQEQECDMARRTSLEHRQSALNVIRNDVVGCQRCPDLACSRTQTVFGVGNIRPRLCFLGEAPGADEDRLGEPFVGRAGQLLTDIIQKAMGLQRSEVYILNVLKCRPPGNRTPTDEEIANCREFFESQLEVLAPEFICCLGATAVRGLLQQTQPLGRMRGKWYLYGKSRVLVTYHPSYLLRNPAAKKDTWEDIKMLMREMNLPIRPRA
ncbi:MAG: uracil-DNA glycosylase [Pirellulaceae bacterium]